MESRKDNTLTKTYHNRYLTQAIYLHGPPLIDGRGVSEPFTSAGVKKIRVIFMVFRYSILRAMERHAATCNITLDVAKATLLSAFKRCPARRTALGVGFCHVSCECATPQRYEAPTINTDAPHMFTVAKSLKSDENTPAIYQRPAN